MSQLMQDGERRLVVANQYGLGDLEFEPARRQAGRRQRGDDRQRQRPLLNCTGETLTASLISSGQVAASAQAVVSTHSPSRRSGRSLRRSE